MNSPFYFRNRKDRRERMLRKMANMRAAKERKRLENPVEREPKMLRTTGLSWAVRDDLTGHVEWLPLKSARDTFRKVTVLLKFYQPGFPPRARSFQRHENPR
jgi:hypothetical protein